MSMQEFFLKPTPAGAYHAVSSSKEDLPKKLLRTLLGLPSPTAFDTANLATWLDIEESKASEMVRHMLKINWLVKTDKTETVPKTPLEDLLPELLPPLSSSKKILLADGQGFYITSAGFPHETAEELSAVSADLSSLFDRHKGLLQGNLNFNTGNWSIVDAGGYSQIGFWPMHIGKESFFLILQGMPRFDLPNFTTLVWTLFTRYSPTNKVINRAVTDIS